MHSYKQLVRNVLSVGNASNDRTGVGTICSFGHFWEHRMDEGFPLMTHKRMSLKSIAAELVWFCSGSTDNSKLRELGATIWDEWDTKPDHDLGPIYGRQWRAFGKHEPYHGDSTTNPDQLAQALHQIVTNPTSRRIMVNAWNPQQIENMALPPCHFGFQFRVLYADRLSLMWYQRSCDVMLGLPYNIASYALLLHVFSTASSLTPDSLKCSLGDTHVYQTHIDTGAVDCALNQPTYALPKLVLDADYFSPKEDLTQLAGCKAYLDRLFITQAHETVNQLVAALADYQYSPAIKMDVAV